MYDRTTDPNEWISMFMNHHTIDMNPLTAIQFSSFNCSLMELHIRRKLIKNSFLFIHKSSSSKVSTLEFLSLWSSSFSSLTLSFSHSSFTLWLLSVCPSSPSFICINGKWQWLGIYNKQVRMQSHDKTLTFPQNSRIDVCVHLGLQNLRFQFRDPTERENMFEIRKNILENFIQSYIFQFRFRFLARRYGHRKICR